MLNDRFNAFYRKMFYVFVVVYGCEIGLALWLYPHLKQVIPLHIGLSGVDSVTKAKYTMFLLPVICIFASSTFRSEVIDRKYLKGSPTSNYLKVVYFLLQVLMVLASIAYFYVIYSDYTRF